MATSRAWQASSFASTRRSPGRCSKMPIVLRCHQGVGPAVTGTALVAADNFSAPYALARFRGVFSRPSHKLAGESYVDRILVLDGATGGVATAGSVHDIFAVGIVPRALIFNRGS